MKKKTSVIFLIFTLLMVLFFTFQNPAQSKALSETIRGCLANIGIEVEYKTLRSNIHVLEYFIVGLSMCCFCKRNRDAMVCACVIGLIDEIIKVFLPGREFSSRDLIKDFIGIGIAALLISIVRRSGRCQ